MLPIKLHQALLAGDEWYWSSGKLDLGLTIFADIEEFIPQKKGCLDYFVGLKASDGRSRVWCIQLIRFHRAHVGVGELWLDVQPGTHQANADELVATKADCGVGSPRQHLGPKLPWHTKPTRDTQRPSSTSVLCFSRALVNSQSEWSEGPTSSDADSTCRIVQKSRRGPTSADGTEHTEKT